MATIGQINIGMTTDTAPLSKGLAGASSKLRDFGGKLEGVSTSVKGLFAGLAAGGAAAAITHMAGQAAHLQESFNKIDAVFGPAADGVSQQARDMAGAFGISVTEMTDAAGRLGSMFRGAGFDAQPAADYTNTLTRLANDLSRFNDTSFETAFDKLRSGLAGESEPLRDFGIFLDEDMVKARALQLGLADMNGELDAGAKIQARASLILEQSGAAIGAAGREADGASAKMEALSGRWENLTTAIGEQFAPVVGDAMGGLATGIQVLGGYWSDLSATVAAWGGSALESLGLAGKGVNLLEVGIGGLANAWQLVRIAWRSLQGELTDGLRGVVSLLATAVEGFDSASEALTGWSSGMGSQLRTMADSMADSVAEMRRGVVEEWARPWASDAVSLDFQKVRDENAKLRAELAAKPLVLPVVPKAARAPSLADEAADPLATKVAGPPALAGRGDSKFAAASLAGSKEALETVLRGQSLGRGDKTGPKVEQNTRTTVDVLRLLDAKLAKMLGQGEEPLPVYRI